MEKVSEATARYVRGAPTKVRLVADTIRGRPVSEALGRLQLSERRAAKHVEKVLPQFLLDFNLLSEKKNHQINFILKIQSY